MAILGLSKSISAGQNHFRSEVIEAGKQSKPPLFRQIAIHSSRLASEDAIDGNSQRGSLAIHSAPAADHQIRKPYKI